MNTKNLILICLLLFTSMLYIQFLGNRFAGRGIEIKGHTQKTRPGVTTGQPVISFKFNRTCRLSSILVIDVLDLVTNDTPIPLWSVTSDTRSDPINYFFYGEEIGGMRTLTKPKRLDSNTVYRVLVTSGRQRSEFDFRPSELKPQDEL